VSGRSLDKCPGQIVDAIKDLLSLAESIRLPNRLRIFAIEFVAGWVQDVSSKFTLGGDASVAAGPVGRTSSAETDLQLNAEILSYSRSRGLFAGVALNGATLRPDEGTNTELYGDQVTNREIVTGTMTRKSAAGTKLTAAMNKYSLQNQ
jgi:lipid-binding SYLF domain-containing protein